MRLFWADYEDFQTDENYTYDANSNRTNTGYSTGDNNQLLSDGTFDYEYDAEGPAGWHGRNRARVPLAPPAK